MERWPCWLELGGRTGVKRGVPPPRCPILSHASTHHPAHLPGHGSFCVFGTSPISATGGTALLAFAASASSFSSGLESRTLVVDVAMKALMTRSAVAARDWRCRGSRVFVGGCGAVGRRARFWCVCVWVLVCGEG